MNWYSATEVARLLSAAPATIIGLIEDGQLEAINIARASSVRKRWRISEAMLSMFQEKCASRAASTSKDPSPNRLNTRPTTSSLAVTGGGK